ncbi:N-formylglutamate deformylase [Brevundimonas sp.]|uniref:N-formylglutamate deformylase n=1 Tax=Brevundimonas sp. TaxID=1871086 RepID=UPI002737A17B|nr:N-formylglutamate deformylase [Brevundimonas sp.]MDP3800733.1 N-formylglutamate deformylase [Brevundimonas sp.]
MTDWLTVTPGDAPLIVAVPHAGTDIPAAIEARMADPWRARKDADWWIDRLYAFAGDLGATVVRTAVSRSVIDVNRDPSGQSLYPGMTTTGLCPVETFDGEPLYRPGEEPDAIEIEARRTEFFDPYHAALTGQIERLSAAGPVVLYDAHSIRSRVPRLFDGQLPQFNIGDNGGVTCAPALTAAVEAACLASGDSHVVNGRFKGGWTTRCYGRPDRHVHAIQMELACRGYVDEPAEASPATWPTPFDPARAEPLTRTLRHVLTACRDFALSQRA